MGACLWRTVVKVFWKSGKLTVLLLLRFLSKSDHDDDEIYYDHAHDHDEIYDFTRIYYDSMNLK